MVRARNGGGTPSEPALYTGGTMRVRIIRWTDPVSSGASLRVQRWCAGQWEPVRDFSLGESDPAYDFAMKLSMSQRLPTEIAMFKDGDKLGSLPQVDSVSDPSRHNFVMEIVTDKPFEGSP